MRALRNRPVTSPGYSPLRTLQEQGPRCTSGAPCSRVTTAHDDGRRMRTWLELQVWAVLLVQSMLNPLQDAWCLLK
jgi:hypothetical protein